MDFRAVNDSNDETSPSRSSMVNIVDILGEAENIVLGLKPLGTDPYRDAMCPTFRIGRPILEPLDSCMEPTPLGPSAVLPKVLQRRTEVGMQWKLIPNAGFSLSQLLCTNQLPTPLQQHPSVIPPLDVSEPSAKPTQEEMSKLDISFSSLDDTPLTWDYVDELEAPVLVSSSSSMSSKSFTSSKTETSSKLEQQGKKRRARKFKEDQWNVRYQDLLRFRCEEGHVMVPHSYPRNQKLAQWVKRQRYQYRLKQMGKHSTLSDAREEILNAADFVWDSHRATWSDHFQTLEAFAAANGHCYVPPQMCKENASLITWCKHQRRQYKRLQAGLESTMTTERIRCLESIGFDWDPRNLSCKKA